MTEEQIADYIVEQFKSDSGIVLGIPAKHSETLRGLLKLAAKMARTELKEEKENL